MKDKSKIIETLESLKIGTIIQYSNINYKIIEFNECPHKYTDPFCKACPGKIYCRAIGEQVYKDLCVLCSLDNLRIKIIKDCSNSHLNVIELISKRN